MSNRTLSPIVIEQQRNGVLIAGAEPHAEKAGTEPDGCPRPRGPVMIEDPQWRTPGWDDVEGLRMLESCAFTWIFDVSTLLFRRMPRNAYTSFHVPTQWTPYFRLEIDECRFSFSVTLNEAGTRMLRASLHADPCDRCRPLVERTVGAA